VTEQKTNGRRSSAQYDKLMGCKRLTREQMTEETKGSQSENHQKDLGVLPEDANDGQATAAGKNERADCAEQ
jgi:hypothetical protein